jgi:hypothetical protein
MKIKLIIIAIILSTSMANLVAQNSNTPEKKAEVLTNKMIIFYGLTTPQTNKVRPLNLNYIKNDTDLRIKYKDSPTELKAKQNDLQTQYDNDILAALNAVQQETYRHEMVKRNASREAKQQQKAGK